MVGAAHNLNERMTCFLVTTPVSWQMQGSKGFVQRKLPLLVPTRLTLENMFFFSSSF